MFQIPPKPSNKRNKTLTSNIPKNSAKNININKSRSPGSREKNNIPIPRVQSAKSKHIKVKS